MSDDDWENADWENDDEMDKKLEALKMETVVDLQAEEDEKRKKEETALAAQRFQERAALKQKQEIAKRRIEELRRLEENLTDEDRIEMERLLEDEAAMEMAADLFDDDDIKGSEANDVENGASLKSASIDDLVKELCSRMDVFDDFGNVAEVLAAELVLKMKNEKNLGNFLKTTLRNSVHKLAIHRIAEVAVVIETIKADAQAAKDKTNKSGAAKGGGAKGAKGKKAKKKELAQKSKDFGEASMDKYDDYAMDYDGYDDFM